MKVLERREYVGIRQQFLALDSALSSNHPGYVLSTLGISLLSLPTDVDQLLTHLTDFI